MGILGITEISIRHDGLIRSGQNPLVLALVFLLALTAPHSSKAYEGTGPKLKVKLLPAEDRWITFADGARLYHGAEVPHLLAQTLFDSGRFTVVAVPKFKGSTTATDDLNARLLGQALTYSVTSLPPSNRGGSAKIFAGSDLAAHVVIQPRIETLLYASGERSNRLTLGFAPDRMNPFNEGRAGALDNEFTINNLPHVGGTSSDSFASTGASPSLVGTGADTAPACPKPDFFGNQVVARGFGPWKSNYGADSDEGFVFQILGFGIGFKKKSYRIKSEIYFDVSYPILGGSKTYRYETTGKGLDLFLAGAYNGLSVELEIQRRKTLRKALLEILPKIMTDFVGQFPNSLWQSQILQVAGQNIMMNDGALDGVQPGLLVVSNFGATYRVTQTQEHVSFLEPVAGNTTKPFAGEQLRLHSSTEDPWKPHIGLASALSVRDPESHSLEVQLASESSPKEVQSSSAACSRAKLGWWERMLNNLFSLYALYRYAFVYDQPIQNDENKILPMADSVKVAMISSGISPKEKPLRGLLEPSGFDFLSWDTRPSDDLGMGTAAALLLQGKTAKPLALVPYRVIGAFGEIHSAALYAAMEHASRRTDLRLIVIPFAPAIKSRAYEMGIEKMLAAGQVVVVPESVSVTGAVRAKSAAQGFVTKGMHSQIELSPEGAGVVEEAARWINRSSGR